MIRDNGGWGGEEEVREEMPEKQKEEERKRKEKSKELPGRWEGENKN